MGEESMKKAMAFLGLGILAAVVLRAEVYVRGVHHIPGGYRYGRNVPRLAIFNEWWIGKDKAAFSSSGWAYEYSGNTDWQLVLDKARGRMIIVNLSEKAYWEIALNAPLAAFVDAAALRWLSQFKVYGQTSSTGGRASVLGKYCREIEIAEWIISNDEDRFYDRRRKSLVTADIPFNWKLAREVFLWAASLFNPQEAYVAEMEKLGGFVLASDEETSEGGSIVTWSFKVDEMDVRRPPRGIFDPPVGFKKLEKLDVKALLGLKSIIFMSPIY
jgi:hypothetical protein